MAHGRPLAYFLLDDNETVAGEACWSLSIIHEYIMTRIWGQSCCLDNWNATEREKIGGQRRLGGNEVKENGAEMPRS